MTKMVMMKRVSLWSLFHNAAVVEEEGNSDDAEEDANPGNNAEEEDEEDEEGDEEEDEEGLTPHRVFLILKLQMTNTRPPL
jgi:hypothetical protein